MDDIAPEPEYEEIGPPKARKGKIKLLFSIAPLKVIPLNLFAFFSLISL